MFGGGVHCSTLDLDREDEYIDYTKWGKYETINNG
jgi:hypothetical protein